MKRPTRILLRIAVGLFIGVALSDILLRLFGLPRFLKLHTFPPQFAAFQLSDGASYYASLPSTQIVFEYDGNPRHYFGRHDEVVHSTNALGFRGREPADAKDTNTLRLAFVGDSVTFGEGVKDEDTYPEQTARLLNQGLASEGTRVESYNFGVGGYNTEQEVALLRSLVLKTQPDIVILGYSLNDAEPALFTIDAGTGQLRRRQRDKLIDWRGDPRPPEGLLFKLKLSQLLWQASSKLRLTRDMTAYYASLYEEENPSWQVTKKALGEFAEICDRHTIPCWVVVFPLLYRLDETYPFTAIHEKVKDALAEAGSPHLQVIDLLGLLRGKSDTTLWVHPTDHHPNETVHRLVAEVLVPKLSKAQRRQGGG